MQILQTQVITAEKVKQVKSYLQIADKRAFHIVWTTNDTLKHK